MKNQVRQWVVTFVHALQKSCPIIFFFLLSFVVVYELFGIYYSIVVSVVTVFFQTRYQKNNNTIRKYLKILFFGSLLLFLAVLSTKNLFWCVGLNVCVPFILVFTQSSQFKPKGYFSYAMLFVFLSLIPPANIEEFWAELLAFWVCVALLALSIGIYFMLFVKSPGKPPLTLEDALCELSELMFLLIQKNKKKELESRFQDLLHDFQQTSYHQDFFSLKTKENQIYDMIGTLIQRFSYMITDEEWKKEMNPEHILLLGRLATFLKETAKWLNTPQQEKQIQIAQMHLDYMVVPEGRVRIFCRSILHMMILILKTNGVKNYWLKNVNPVNWKEIWEQVRSRFSLETFEMRLAMRLSIVMTVSCTLSYILPVTHSYWIPLNAFLLLQPDCEESSYRMKTRPVGTVIGCGIEFLVHPFLPGLGAQLAFALVMISLMYCSTPGTWYHPVFSTCYALTLASMTMNETTAITLRITYLLVAVAIVFLVNRFFFPIRREALFRYNIRALLRLNRSYWVLIEKGLKTKTDLSVSGEILTYFHMLYEECLKYLKKNAEEGKKKEYRMILLTLWHMFSELEQMHYLVRAGAVSEKEKIKMAELIDSIKKDLYPNLNDKDFAGQKEKFVFEKPEISYVLCEYIRHARLLGAYRDCIPFCVASR